MPDGKGWLYSNESMISDLMVFWSLFNDVFELIGKNGLAEIIRADDFTLYQFRRIVQGESPCEQDGAFWYFSKDAMRAIPLARAIGDDLPDVLRTLRNGYAHIHWIYVDLSAIEYWETMGWQTENSIPAFDLHHRQAKNYMIYIADAGNWNPQHFWSLPNLRIMVTHTAVLRYHLHLFLNYVLNGSMIDLFGNDIANSPHLWRRD